MDLEISGSGLEFVERHYPEQLRVLRTLVERNQVELLSSLYTPSAWIAFPRRDLVKSIELNQRCLKRLGFPWSRLFFAQEAFFGAGVSLLTDFFDVAVCKDDYLSHYYRAIDWSPPLFSLEDMRVVVASNHILNELSHWVRGGQDVVVKYGLTEAHMQHLDRTLELNQPHNFPASRGAYEGTQWLWYHCGDGNHYGSPYKPDDPERCYYDAQWAGLVRGYIDHLADSGSCLTLVGEYVFTFRAAEPAPLPPLIEGPWNSRRAEGVLCWMGHNATSAENDAGILASISQARSRLVAAETSIAADEASGDLAPLRAQLEEAWTALLHAQISDTLGWHASSQAVAYSLRLSNHALMIATRVLEAVRGDGESECLETFDAERAGARVSPHPDKSTITLYGCSGSGQFGFWSECASVYECQFKVSDLSCGIRFPFEMDALVYCPSGREEVPITVPRALLRTSVVALPLANGLIQVAEGTFLIKDTRFVHVAAEVNFNDRTVQFGIRNARQGWHYRWRFYLFAGAVSAAVEFANKVNAV